MFYLIHGFPIYLNRKYSDDYFKNYYKDSDTPLFDTLGDRMYPNSDKMKKKKENLRLFLEKEYNDNPNIFIAKWLKFEFIGEEARDNYFYLMSDYCKLTNNSYMQNFNIDPDMADIFTNPPGEDVGVAHLVKPLKWWWKYTKGIKNKGVSIIISVKKVKKIFGRLDNFNVIGDGFQLVCTVEGVTVTIE